VPTSFAAQWLVSLVQTEAIQQYAAKKHVKASDQEVAQARQQFTAQGSQNAAAFAQLPKWLQNQLIETTALQIALRSTLKPSVSDTKLAAAYQQLAYRTSRGALFNKSSLTRMLQNKKYIGYYVFDGTEVEGGMPKLIEENIFNEVQEKIKSNKRHSARPASNVLSILTSKLFCGCCGALMVGESGTSATGKTYNYYKCNTRKFKKKCDASQVKKEWIEYLVVDETKKQVLTPENMEIIAERCSQILIDENNSDVVLNSLRERHKEIERGIANLVRVAEKTATESIGERIAQLESEKWDLEMRIADESKTKPALNKTHFIFWLSRFAAGDVENADYRRSVVSALIRRVIMFEHKIIVEYNISDDAKGVKTLIIKDLDDPNLSEDDSSESSHMVKVTQLYPNVYFADKVLRLVINL
jgi:hypothetical protein